MNEVEKMYENAGLHKKSYIAVNFNDKIFTAEKQLELIKWLAKRPLTLLIGRYKGKYYFGSSNFSSKADSFDNAIAIRINDLWQDLTDTERKQIKEILE